MGNEGSMFFASGSEHASIALLIIDVINDLDFPEGEQLRASAEPMSRRILWLKQRCRSLGIPIIYVNDNFGRWQSDFKALVRRCVGEGSCGAEIVQRLKPDEDDYFVLKPKHSGFYETTLATLLRYLGAEKLILTGMAANICVLFTANDAYMRDFKLFVPEDCVASNTQADNDYALKQMSGILKADTRPSHALVDLLSEDLQEVPDRSD